VKLRARLALTLLATAIPVIAGIAVLRERLQWAATEQGLANYALDRMQNGGREACEQNPEVFPPRPMLRPPDRQPPPGRGAPLPNRPRLNPLGTGGGPPLEAPATSDPRLLGIEVRSELWAYGPDFHSRNREAPTFPSEIRAALEAGASHASVEWFVPTHDGIAVGVRMPWDEGPCAFVLVRRSQVDTPGAQQGLIAGAAVLLVVLLSTAILSAGPVVARIRTLTEQVRESAASRYARPADVRGSD
jgi:hypothetical protein